jgi:hypothetical protein
MSGDDDGGTDNGDDRDHHSDSESGQMSNDAADRGTEELPNAPAPPPDTAEDVHAVEHAHHAL